MRTACGCRASGACGRVGRAGGGRRLAGGSGLIGPRRSSSRTIGTATTSARMSVGRAPSPMFRFACKSGRISGGCGVHQHGVAKSAHVQQRHRRRAAPATIGNGAASRCRRRGRTVSFPQQQRAIAGGSAASAVSARDLAFGNGAAFFVAGDSAPAARLRLGQLAGVRHRRLGLSARSRSRDRRADLGWRPGWDYRPSPDQERLDCRRRRRYTGLIGGWSAKLE